MATAQKLPAELMEEQFRDSDFRILADLAKKNYGLNIVPSKKALVHSRLARRLRARGLGSMTEYCMLIQEPREEEERQMMLQALTTNVTNFFREMHHFTQFEEECLPLLAERARRGGRVRIWSSACSSGQEPYSIAASLLRGFPDARKYDVKILASDIDQAILEKALRAEYAGEELDGLDNDLRSRLFGEGLEKGAKGTPLRVREELRALVTFRLLNLIGDWPMKSQFDVIFCRNVAIYFDRETQERLWGRFAEKLPLGGMLFIGHSERVSGPAQPLLKAVGITAYRRVEAAGANQKGGRT